jgi:hypothetical protein
MRKLSLYTPVIMVLMLASCSTLGKTEADTVTMASQVAVMEEKPVIDTRSGFRYDLPEFMEESPDDAYSYRYDNLLIEKGMKFYESQYMIAIRSSDSYSDYTLERFADYDQMMLRNQMQIQYENRWEPPGLSTREIPYLSYQFNYRYGQERFYQRSVYIKCDTTFYIVSLTSREKEAILDDKHDVFWDSIRID